MPIKVKRVFEREYGKKRGDRIFYAWENKKRRENARTKKAKGILRKSRY